MNNDARNLLEATNFIKPYFNEIIKPLKNIGINNFSYYKVYKDGKSFYICSDKRWNDLHYCSEGGFDGVVRTIQNCVENNIDQVIFSGDPGKASGKIADIYGLNKPMNVEKMLDFNLWNSISYYRFSENFFEAYNLFGGNDKDCLGNFFEAKNQHLTMFLSYFTSEFTNILEKSVDKKEWISLNGITLKNKFFDLKLNNNLITNYGKEISITEKQLAVIELISKGLPIKCIEYELGISSTTIKNYINRLKIKFNCISTEELVRLWFENRK